jgi:L-ribulose-5-phosphate 3-epimerase
MDPAILIMVTADDPVRAVHTLKDNTIHTLGEGSVDYLAYLEALHQIGYTGFLTIGREIGENPEKNIKKAVNLLNVMFG